MRCRKQLVLAFACGALALLVLPVGGGGVDGGRALGGQGAGGPVLDLRLRVDARRREQLRLAGHHPLLGPRQRDARSRPRCAPACRSGASTSGRASAISATASGTPSHGSPTRASRRSTCRKRLHMRLYADRGRLSDQRDLGRLRDRHDALRHRRAGHEPDVGTQRRGGGGDRSGVRAASAVPMRSWPTCCRWAISSRPGGTTCEQQGRTGLSLLAVRRVRHDGLRALRPETRNTPAGSAGPRDAPPAGCSLNLESLSLLCGLATVSGRRRGE